MATSKAWVFAVIGAQVPATQAPAASGAPVEFSSHGGRQPLRLRQGPQQQWKRSVAGQSSSARQPRGAPPGADQRRRGSPWRWQDRSQASPAPARSGTGPSTTAKDRSVKANWSGPTGVDHRDEVSRHHHSSDAGARTEIVEEEVVSEGCEAREDPPREAERVALRVRRVGRGEVEARVAPVAGDEAAARVRDDVSR